MRNDERYYRQHAEEAQKQADRAISERDRANWLRIAQSWMALIRGHVPTPQERFDEATEDRGTGQDVSKESQ